ncbi:unnamed protein product [Phyllotreta striolata]|uniref:Transmembrane protein 164 n=1 Tax=Phyllotreta striolata TaxID=444603 RepID=A0A9N9TU33_PHYSR|nr:unnamed protein product [Phyllotreta striolata]
MNLSPLAPLRSAPLQPRHLDRAPRNPREDPGNFPGKIDTASASTLSAQMPPLAKLHNGNPMSRVSVRINPHRNEIEIGHSGVIRGVRITENDGDDNGSGVLSSSLLAFEAMTMDWDWIRAGVSTAVPRNAGPECAVYLNPTWRVLETVLALSIASWLIWFYYPKLRLPDGKYLRRNTVDRTVLLVALCVLLGLEIGYKFSTKTVIFLLNPCHITTAIQIFLLASKPSKTVTALFRLQLNLMNGPVLAYMFPETDTRLLPLENFVYWAQHGMIFVVPYYLLRMGGEFNIEDPWDMSWCGVSYGINLLYHFVILQGFSILTEINLNHMLCPAILDPFESQLYRTAAITHEAFLCPFLCKMYCLVAKRLQDSAKEKR